MTTKKELVEYLQQFPDDAVIITAEGYQSDYFLDSVDITPVIWDRENETIEYLEEDENGDYVQPERINAIVFQKL